MKKKLVLYPGVNAAEKEKGKARQDLPDFISCTPGRIVPNYDKYSGVDPEKVLVWLNID